MLEKRSSDDYLRGNDILAKIIEYSINKAEYRQLITDSISPELIKKLSAFIDNSGSIAPISDNETNNIKNQLTQAFDKIFNNLSKELPEKSKLICASIYKDLSNKKNHSITQTIRALFLNRFVAPVFIQAASHHANQKSQILYLRILPMTAQGFSTIPEKKDNLGIPQLCKDLAFDENYRKKIDAQFKLLCKSHLAEPNKSDKPKATSDNLFATFIDQAKKFADQFKKDIQNEIDDIEDKLKLINYRLKSIGKPLTANTATALTEQEIAAIKIRFENQKEDKNVGLVLGIRLSGLQTEFSKLQTSQNSKKDEQLKAVQIFREFINDLEKMTESNQPISSSTPSPPKTKRITRERSNTVITPGSDEHEKMLVSLKLVEEPTQAIDNASNTTRQQHVRSNVTFFGSTTPTLLNDNQNQSRKTSEPSSLPSVLQRKKSVPALGLNKVKPDPAKEKNKTSLTARPQQ